MPPPDIDPPPQPNIIPANSKTAKAFALLGPIWIGPILERMPTPNRSVGEADSVGFQETPRDESGVSGGAWTLVCRCFVRNEEKRFPSILYSYVLYLLFRGRRNSSDVRVSRLAVGIARADSKPRPLAILILGVAVFLRAGR